jgi:dihydroorotate dehydrogenase
LRTLVEQVVNRARELTTRRTIPVLVKVAPDLNASDLLAAADAAAEGGAAGLIATNTTVGRDGLLTDPLKAREDGGLSGRPLRARALDVCRVLYRHLQGTMPIIGVGGIGSADDAYARIKAGATLLQLYTVLIYEGPGVVSRIVRGLAERLERDGLSHISEAVGTDVG